MGVAVQSHYFSVGSVVSWARAGVGAVATQAMLDVKYGPLGLELMAAGMSAPGALRALLAADGKPEYRQVAMVDSKGRVASHTGKKCIPEAGSAVGGGVSCQANIMRSRKVWTEMLRAFERSPALSLKERLMGALDAGEAAGGDLRGRQSAAMVVVGPKASPNRWEGRLVDLRVEDHPDPLKELRRLLRYHEGYAWVDQGDDRLSSGKMDDALTAYSKGMKLVPEVLELKYWVAIGLVSSGKDRARGVRMLKEVCAEDRNWVRVTRGLVKTGVSALDPSVLRQVSR
ncbi:MAG: DUF1028 domain-containing protein [Nitrososphaerota archaeon]|nr:DUF1028 domain-containing protein [Nitrososphaerota archaeon]